MAAKTNPTAIPVKAKFCPSGINYNRYNPAWKTLPIKTILVFSFPKNSVI